MTEHLPAMDVAVVAATEGEGVCKVSVSIVPAEMTFTMAVKNLPKKSASAPHFYVSPTMSTMNHMSTWLLE
jgi:hypothetical protein